MNSDQEDQLHLTIFTNFSLTRAYYHAPHRKDLDGNQVELVPPFNFKAGLNFQMGKFHFYGQYSITAKQYSDASNAIFTPSAIEGIIPSYQVADLSTRYSWKKIEIEAGINNLLNNYYFTRRATGYPGPGIIPSDGRSFYLTLGVKI